MSDDLERQLATMATTMAAKLRDAQIARRTATMEMRTDWISDAAWLCWSKGELRYFLAESPVWRDAQKLKREDPTLYSQVRSLGQFGRFNGYVRFPKLPVVAPGIHGIVDYVAVHGGITFFQEWWDGSVTYGFDTGHAQSMDITEIINDVGWMMAETESMGRGIQIAARFERFYLNALDDNGKKARVLDRMGKFMPVGATSSMNIMLNLLRGEL